MWKKYKALDVVSKSLGLNLIFARLSLVALPETCIPISASVGLPRLGPKIKTAVMGILERGGEIRVGVVGNRRKKEMHGEINRHVAAGSAVYTDAFMSYVGLKKQGFAHQIIGHAERYVDGQVHTNGLENFWSLLKRGLKGTYVSVEPFHLFRYLDEQVFRYNFRKLPNDGARFEHVASHILGKRLSPMPRSLARWARRVACPTRLPRGKRAKS